MISVAFWCKLAWRCRILVDEVAGVAAASVAVTLVTLVTPLRSLVMPLDVTFIEIAEIVFSMGSAEPCSSAWSV